MSGQGKDYATKHRWQNRVRWAVASHLNRIPGTCWANLVSWALHRGPLLDRHGDGDIRQNSTCRKDAADNGSCYCAKIRTNDGAA